MQAITMSAQTGLRELSGGELAQMKLGSDFYRDVRLKQLFPKMTVKGVVTRRDADTFTVQDANGVATTVVLTDRTSVKSKGGFLRSGSTYGQSNILRGLNLEVEGRGNEQGQLVAHFGAPSIEDAVAAAEEEFAFAASLCNHPLDTLIALHRSHDGGEIREAFRTLRPKDGPRPLRAFAFLDVEGEDEPADEVDLATMAKTEKSEK